MGSYSLRDDASKKTIERVALVGLGSIGRRHLRLLKIIRPELEVILVRSGKGEPWPEEGLATCSVNSISEAIEKHIDAAIISSPSPYHVKQAIEFVKAGVPLLVEKPLSHNLDDIQKLKELSDRSRSLILVGYVLRHSVDLKYFRQMLSRNLVGQMSCVTIVCSSYLPDWRPEQDYRLTASARKNLGGGVLLELSHELDYANWLFGPFQSVKATLQNSGTLDIDVEDTANITLINDSGLKISIELDFWRRNLIRQCSVEGATGRLSWDGIAHSTSLANERIDDVLRTFTVDRDDMFREQLVHFLSCVELGNLPKVSLDDGIEVMTLIESVRRSSSEKAVLYL